MHSAQRGYTLIEIIIVLTISSLLFVGGYTQYREYSRRQVLNNTVEELKNNLNLARQLAFSGEKATSGCILASETLQGYQINFTSSSYSIKSVCSSTATSNRSTFALPAAVTISTSGLPTISGTTYVIYKVVGKGTNLSSNGTITVTDTVMNKTSTVVITPKGTTQ